MNDLRELSFEEIGAVSGGNPWSKVLAVSEIAGGLALAVGGAMLGGPAAPVAVAAGVATAIGGAMDLQEAMGN